jgi:hypothetical protein
MLSLLSKATRAQCQLQFQVQHLLDVLRLVSGGDQIGDFI